MSSELIVIIIGFVTLLLSLLGVFIQLNARIDKLDAKFDAKFDKLQSELSAKIDKIQFELSTRIDNVNLRLDNLYHELFKRDAA